MDAESISVGKKYVSIMNFETFICVFPLGNPLYLAYMIAPVWKIIAKIFEYPAAYIKMQTLNSYM